jgi:hypothetical protein
MGSGGVVLGHENVDGPARNKQTAAVIHPRADFGTGPLTSAGANDAFLASIGPLD